MIEREKEIVDAFVATRSYKKAAKLTHCHESRVFRVVRRHLLLPSVKEAYLGSGGRHGRLYHLVQQAKTTEELRDVLTCVVCGRSCPDVMLEKLSVCTACHRRVKYMPHPRAKTLPPLRQPKSPTCKECGLVFKTQRQGARWNEMRTKDLCRPCYRRSEAGKEVIRRSNLKYQVRNRAYMKVYNEQKVAKQLEEIRQELARHGVEVEKVV